MNEDGTGRGYNFGGEKAARLSAALAAVRQQNQSRRKCRRCGNLVLPRLMAQHNAAYHDAAG